MKQLKIFYIKSHLFVQSVFQKLFGTRFYASSADRSNRDTSDINSFESPIYKFLVYNNTLIGTPYSGNIRKRRIKVKSLTEVLALYARLCDGNPTTVSQKVGRLVCWIHDVDKRYSIKLSIRKRKIPRNTIATMSFYSDRTNLIPIDEIFFCEKT